MADPIAATPPGFLEPTFGQRLLARLVDLVVLLVPLLAVQLIADGRLRQALALLVVSAYEIGFVARAGQTPGKRALDIRVVALDGTTPAPAAATRRWLVVAAVAVAALVVELPDTLGGFWALVVLLPVLQGPLHRGLHDRAAGTVVTRTG